MRLVKVSDPIPLIGHIAFGIIDRGTNMLQVRPFSNCPMSCIFCSVDAGPNTKTRVTEYIVDPDYLIEWTNYIVQKKIHDVSILIDGVGEPILHPDIVKIVKGIKENRKVFEVAIETHGLPLNERLIKSLANAGLDRINLSLDSLDEVKAKQLTGHKGYNVSNILKMIDFALSEGIDIMLTPVWVKGINDNDIVEIVKYGKEKGLLFGIQKYVQHPRGRKIGVEVSWSEFKEFISNIEHMLNISSLFLSPKNFKIYQDVTLGPIFKINERVIGEVVLEGWLKNEVIISAKNRVITIVGASDIPKGVSLKVRIIRNKDEIYIAKF